MREYSFRRTIWRIIASIMMTVEISTPVIIQRKYRRLEDDFDVYLDFLTEFSSVVLLATKIIERMIKIAVLTEIEASTPLYEEKSTIVESKTTTAVKTSIKINELFLLSVKLP